MIRIDEARSALLLVGALCACAVGCGDRGGPHSRGSLKFDAQLLGDRLTTDDAIAAFLATEHAVLTSGAMLRAVVADLKLQQPFGATEQEALVGLQRAVDVRRVEGSLVLEVRIFNEDTHAATMVCNRVLEAYINDRRRARIEPHRQREEWLAKQIDRLRGEMKTDGGPSDYVAESNSLLDRLLAEATDVGLRARGYESDVTVLDRCLAHNQ